MNCRAEVMVNPRTIDCGPIDQSGLNSW